MNAIINVLLQRVDDFFSEYKKQGNLYAKKNYRKENKKIFSLCIILSALGVIDLGFLIIFKHKVHIPQDWKNIMIGGGFYFWGLGIFGYLFSKSVYKKFVNQDLIKDTSMYELALKVFNNQIPNNEELLFIKSMIEKRYKERILHRNIFITIEVILVNFIFQLFIKLITNNQYVSLNVLTLSVAVSVMLFWLYTELDKNSKYAKLNSFFIKEGETLSKMDDLLDYLIFENK